MNNLSLFAYMHKSITRDKTFLRRPTTPVASIEEGEEIASKLLKVIHELQTDHRIRVVGLSANQIGISKRVSVIVGKNGRVWKLINPIIETKSDEMIKYLEGCMSLPGKTSVTLRHQKVSVRTDNYANVLVFGPDVEPITKESVNSDEGLLECISVQHEIDHLDGKLMTDVGVRVMEDKSSSPKYGRNDKVIVEKDGQTQYIKYKKALELVQDGWKIL